MTERGERAGVEDARRARDDVGEGALAGEERAPVALEPTRDARRVDVDRLAADRRAGEQHAGLLERLPDRRDPEPQRAGSAQQTVRVGGITAVAPCEQLRLRVVAVDGTTREHVRAGHERGARAAAQHEDLRSGASRTSITVAASRGSTYLL